MDVVQCPVHTLEISPEAVVQAVNRAGRDHTGLGGRSPGTGAEGGRKGGLQTADDLDLPQTLGPPAYAPYPSPVLSEEEDLLLDSPPLEVSDSESDEALVTGPEGRGSEAGMWEQVGWGDSNCRWEEGTKGPWLPKYLQYSSAEGSSQVATCWLCDLGHGPLSTSLCLGFLSVQWA